MEGEILTQETSTSEPKVKKSKQDSVVWLDDVLSEDVVGENKESNENDKMKEELTRYVTEPQNKSIDALKWWAHRLNVYPVCSAN
jgi:hypothetical protein